MFARTLLATAAVALFAPAPASAVVNLSVNLSFSKSPLLTHAGERNLTLTIDIANTSSGAQQTGTVTLTSLSLLPSCGTEPLDQCLTFLFYDPATYDLAATATGTGTTNVCTGKTFNVVLTNAATGEVALQPVGGPVVLASATAEDALKRCRIALTFDAAKVPNHDASPEPQGLPGDQTLTFATVAGMHQDGTTGTVTGSLRLTVAQAATTYTNTTSATSIGQPMQATFSVFGSTIPISAPTGSVNFRLFRDAACTDEIDVLGSSVPLIAGTATFNGVAEEAGTFYWKALYPGDANNHPALNQFCGDPGTEMTVAKAQPAIALESLPPSRVGEPIRAVAKLSGAGAPGGSVTMSLYTGQGCTGEVFSGTAPVAGGYVVLSSTPATAVGTYYWRVAYPGDVNNQPTASVCDDPGGVSQVLKAGPELSVQASGPASVGDSLSAVATLEGAGAPTGTMTFRLFSDAACTAEVATSADRPVSGAQTSSSGVTATAPGTYFWTASYGGDANHEPATSPCTAEEDADVTVSKATPVLTVQPSGPVGLGGAVSAVATLGGGLAPTGTMTFRLSGPDDPGCAASTPTTTAVAGNGDYNSGPSTPDKPGTWRWLVTYSGDANHNAVTVACGAPVAVGAPPAIAPPGLGPITSTPGNDRLTGTNGDDVIDAGAGNDVIDAGAGNDVINCGPGNDVVVGGAGNDTINCEGGNDRVDGGAGDDRLNGGAGKDRLNGGPGKDRLSGGSGDDTLSGGAGNDELRGDAGRDKLNGNAGRDKLNGGAGRDVERQ